MCLAQGHNAVPPVRLNLQPFHLESSPRILLSPHYYIAIPLYVILIIRNNDVKTTLEHHLGNRVSHLHTTKFYPLVYSETCVKQPLKNRQNKDLNDK